MKILLNQINVILVIIVLQVTGCTPQIATQEPAFDAKATVLNMIERFNAGDLDGAMNFFADDAGIFFYGLPPTGAEIYLGKDKVRPVFEENVASHFKWEIEIISASDELIISRAKTWHDFTRQLGVAPIEATEIYEIKDGKIHTYAWTITEESLANLKAALVETMPPESPETPSTDAPVSNLTVTISGGTCFYKGSMVLKTGQINVTMDVKDQGKTAYALTFFTLDAGKDFADLMASTVQPSPPSWSHMFSIVELGPGTSKSYNITAKESPVYLVCWSKPPDMPIGALGPFEVTGDQSAANSESPSLAVSLEDFLGKWITFCPPAHENCTWEFRADGTYGGALVRIPGSVFYGKFTFQNGQLTFETDTGLCSDMPHATYEVYVVRQNGITVELQFKVVGKDPCKDRHLSLAKVRPLEP